jgi:hypothetical protein
VPDGRIVDRRPPPGVAGDPRSFGRRAARHSARPALRGPRRLAWLPLLLLLLLIGAGLFALYFCQSRAAPFNSDGAGNVLQGQAIVTGNPLLRGWWTSDVSFYTTELPEYALVTAIRGLSPDVVHLCGALTYTLTILLAALVARGGTGGNAGGRAGWYRAGLAAGIMLAPSILGGTEVYLENPDHAGTAVPVLLLFLMLGQAGGQRMGRVALPVVTSVLLALAQVGDELTVVAATVPLAAVCALRLLTARRRGAGPSADRNLLAAALISVGLAKFADLIIRALGGFDLRPLGAVALVSPHQVPANARLLWRSLILLFGANNPGAPHQPQTIKAHVLLVSMADVHVIGLVLAGAGLAAGIGSLLSLQADRGTQLLVAAICVVLAAGVFTTALRSLSNAHEVAILLPLGAALAGRVLPRAGTASPSRRRARGRRTRIAPLALGAWLAAGVAELCYAAAWPATPPPQQATAAWLVRQHQRTGLAGYWQAGATTVTSGGQVLVAPIVIPAPSQAVADRWESSAAWYRPAKLDATFVIAVTGPGAPGGLSPAAVRASFGPPAAEHQVGQDLIMLYRYNLLTRVRGTAFPGSR